MDAGWQRNGESRYLNRPTGNQQEKKLVQSWFFFSSFFFSFFKINEKNVVGSA
jgi:hypothetical protein